MKKRFVFLKDIILSGFDVKDFLFFTLMELNIQEPGFRRFIIDGSAMNCCFDSVLDKSFKFHDANTVRTVRSILISALFLLKTKIWP